MNRTFILYVLAMIAVVFNTACERNASNKTRISLQLPKELQEKVNSQSTSLGTLKLRHIALQITGPDFASKLKIVDNGDDKEILETEIFLDEISTGDNRLIQVLAAYAADNSDDASIYYGDVTKSLRNALEPIEVPIAKLGGTGASKMTHINGRYLTSTQDGPTGELKMIYRPAGKPALPVDKKMMVGGWFELSVFQDVPVDFVLDTGLIMGSQWTSASFAPSPSMIRITTPSSFAQKWNNAAGYSFEAREAKEELFGYIAKDPSFLADKKVCVTSLTLNNGTIHHLQALASEDLSSARPFKHYAYGTTPVASANEVVIAGGETRQNCGALASTDEFKKYLWFLPSSGFQNSSTGYEQSLGLGHGFAKYVQPQDERGNQSRNTYQNLSYSAAFGTHLKLGLLPGTESMVEGLQVFESLNNNDAYDDRCDRLSGETWAFKRTMTPILDGANIILKSSDFTPATNYAFCLVVQSKPAGRLNYANFNATPAVAADQMGYGYRKLPFVGECGAVSLQLSTSAPAPSYNPFTSETFTISAAQGSPAAVLYNDAQCSSTPTANLTFSFPTGANSKAFFVKGGSAGNYDLTVTTTATGITLPPTHSFGVTTPPSTYSHLELQSDLVNDPGPIDRMDLYANGCFPLRVQAIDNSGYAANLNGTATISLVDLAGTTLTRPAGFNFYSDCASSTPISAVTFAASYVQSFVVKTGAVVPKDAKIKISGFSLLALANVNLTTQARRLIWEYSGAPAVFSLTTGQCVPLAVRAKDSNGANQTVAQRVYINFTASGAGDPNDAAIFSDNACATRVTQGTIEAGTSFSTYYVRTTKAGANFYLSAYSAQVPSGATMPFTSSTSALIVAGSSGAAAGQTLTYFISGGSAPFSIQAPSGNIVGTPTVTYDTSSDRYKVQIQISGSASSGVPESFTVQDSSPTPQQVTKTISIL